MKHISVIVTKVVKEDGGYSYVYPAAYDETKVANHTYESFHGVAPHDQTETLYCTCDDTMVIGAGITEMTQADWQAAVDAIRA